MKIGLFGFTFAHENMGCQALTCAFLGILRNDRGKHALAYFQKRELE